jgi:hypothetical protein
MATAKELGLVYVLTNQAMPGLVKIGMTTRKDIDARMKELYTTGVPVPFECAYACLVNSKDCEKIEKALHIAFEPNRINSNREFFSIKPEQAIAILTLFNKGDVTEQVNEEIDNDLDVNDTIAKDKAQKHRPPLNFFEMGLHKGDILTYDKDETITVEIVAEKKIRFEGNITSLTAVTTQLRNSPYAVQPTPHWSFQGKSLTDIYNETYPPTDEE